MPSKEDRIAEKKILTYTLISTSDSLKILCSDDKYSKAILHEVIADAKTNFDTQLGDYYQNTLRYLIDAIPIKNRNLINCARWLQKAHFLNFSVLKIYIRYKKKEIMVVSDRMNDAVLNEFYNATFEHTYENDNEIVFIIADEKSIDYSAMPKYDKIIEVVKYE